MTEGKPLKCILIFMLPMILGNLIQLLYSVVDSAIVGQTLGADALTGVGSTGSFSYMVLGFVSGLANGFSVIISQRRGANDEEGMRKSLATGIALTLIIVSALTVVAVFSAKPMLIAMNTQEQFLPYAVDYIMVIFGGMLLSAFSNLFGSTLRAIGDSKVPLYFLIVSCFMNAGMDCLFIMVFGMGVDGAALATVLANGLTAIATFIYLWVRYPVLRFKLSHFKPNLRVYGSHLRLGIPMALQLAVVSIGMIFGQVALNAMPPVAVIAYTAAGRIDGIATGVINVGASAVSVFVGQNYGAKKYDRIKHGVAQFTVFSVCLSIVLGAAVLALNRPLLRIFIAAEDLSEALFENALKYLWFNSGFYILLATLCISRSSLQGMGRGTLTLVSAATEVVVRIIVSVIAMHYASFTIVCMNNAFSWISANLVLIPSFLIVLNKYIPLLRKHKKSSMPEEETVVEQAEENEKEIDIPQGD